MPNMAHGWILEHRAGGDSMTDRTPKDELVCFCFGFTKQAIREDLLAHGRSTIMDKIAASKRTGECQCELLNPKGR